MRRGGSSAVSETEVIVDEEEGSCGIERARFGGASSSTGYLNESAG